MNVPTRKLPAETLAHKSLQPNRSGHELTKRAYLNLLATGLDFGLKTAVTLVLSPILVSGLGSLLFGVWQILIRLIVYISPTDRGPTQALKWLIASKQGSDDHDSKRRDVGSAILVWIMFMPLVIVAGVLVVWLAPTLTNASGDLHFIIRITALLLVFNFILSGVALLPDVILRGMNLGYKRMGLRGILAVLSGVLMASAVYLRYGLIGLAFAEIVTTVVTGLLFWRVARQNVAWLGIARPRRVELKRFFSYSSWFFGSVLVSRVLNLSDVVILGAAVSATAVTTYVLTYYPTQMVVTVTLLIVGAVLPGLGGVIGQKDLERAARVRAEIMATSWFLATAMGTAIILWNHSFVTLWVGNQQFAGQMVTLLLALFAVQLIIAQNDDSIIDLTLDIRAKTALSLVAAVTSVGLAFLMAREWGIAGLTAGLIVGRTVVTLAYPIIIGSYLAIPFRSQLSSAIRPLLALAALFTVAYVFGTRLLARNWLEFIIGIVVTAPIAFGLTWFAGLDARIQRRLLHRANMAIAILKGRLLHGEPS